MYFMDEKKVLFTVSLLLIKLSSYFSKIRIWFILILYIYFLNWKRNKNRCKNSLKKFIL